MTILGATGHQRIPEPAIAYIRRGIDATLQEASNDLQGVSSLAAGADQMFAEALLAQGGQLRVVVPSRGYEETFPPADRRRYHSLLESADEVELLDFPSPSEEAFMAAGVR